MFVLLICRFSPGHCFTSISVSESVVEWALGREIAYSRKNDAATGFADVFWEYTHVRVYWYNGGPLILRSRTPSFQCPLLFTDFRSSFCHLHTKCVFKCLIYVAVNTGLDNLKTILFVTKEVFSSVTWYAPIEKHTLCSVFATLFLRRFNGVIRFLIVCMIALILRSHTFQQVEIGYRDFIKRSIHQWAPLFIMRCLCLSMYLIYRYLSSFIFIYIHIRHHDWQTTHIPNKIFCTRLRWPKYLPRSQIHRFTDH